MSTVDPDMFNRSREIERLSKLLLSPPKLSVVTGPVNSGKSKLLDFVIARLERCNGRIPVHSVNLRQGTYNSVESLVVESLSSDVRTWVDAIKESVSEVSMSQVRVKVNLNKGTPLDRLNYLLQSIARELPAYSILRGKRPPVFFIDEANRLRSLLCDKDGQAALESLFQWFVLHTKEKRHFHVLMASSDSFFNLWVEKFIVSSRYNTYVLGHLNKNDARKYWKNKVLVNNADALKEYGLDPPKFEDVYGVCGGSMLLISSFLEEYCEEKGKGLIGDNPCNFSMVLQEQRKLCASFEPFKTLEENYPPKWTKAHLIKVMQMLLDSEVGVIQYNSACQAIGRDILHSMIEYNLIHMRPTFRLSYDIPEHRKPVITAESPAALMAMKLILKEEK